MSMDFVATRFSTIGILTKWFCTSNEKSLWFTLNLRFTRLLATGIGNNTMIIEREMFI
jgi:hypothetical protein